jgi:hypothetical protein
LVDSSLITTTDAIYSNCIGTSPPKITVERCAHPRDGDALFWPTWDNPEWDRLPTQGPGRSCVTSRYGPFEGFFHFPHRSVPDDSAHDGSDPAHYGPEMAALHDWGWGIAQELKGYQGYVWGPPLSPAHPDGMGIGSGFFGNTCFYTEPVTIDTGMTPGSLEAFATYLHSLADSYSHEECQKRTDGLGWAWPTHTVPLWPVPEARRIYECNYIPDPNRQSIGDSHHGREFGSEPEWADDLQRTDEAIRAVYAELQARSADKEEDYQPLDLDAPLGGRFHKQTLDEALYTFVHKWTFNQPEVRRAYAKQLAEAILALRVPADD